MADSATPDFDLRGLMVLRALVISVLLGIPCLASAQDAPVVPTNVAAQPVDLPPMEPRYDRDQNYVNLLFRPDGLPDQKGFPRDLDDNDVIHVYMAIANTQAKNYTIEFEGEVRGQDVQVLGSGHVGAIPNTILSEWQQTGGGPLVYFGSYGPYSPSSVKITIVDRTDAATPIQRSHVLRVNETYIASLRFGVGPSRVGFPEFDLVAADGSGGMVVSDAADDEGEMRSFLTVAYAWRFWERSDPFWNGRDLEEERGPSSRLNPMVGLGLRDVGEEYLAGLSYELARGLDVFGGAHFAKVGRLTEDLEVGDPFAGEESDLPVRHEWEMDGIWGP